MKNSIPYISRIMVGAIFLAAAFGKAMMHNTLVREINNYQIIHESLANETALILVITELILGLFLILGIKVRWSAKATIGLLGLFFIVKLMAAARGLDVCSVCLGTLLALPAWAAFTLNFTLIAMLYVAIKYHRLEKPSTFKWSNVWYFMKTGRMVSEIVKQQAKQAKAES